MLYGKKLFSVVLVFFVLAFVLACGGGGGSSSSSSSSSDSDNSSAPTYNLIDSNLYKYAGVEILSYDFIYEKRSTYYDYLILSDRGTVNDYFNYVTNNDQNGPQILLRRTSETISKNFDGYVNDHFYYDENNNLIHYMTSNKNYYTNQKSFNDGQLFIPKELKVGMSWNNNETIKFHEGAVYIGSINYTVLSIDKISVPFGDVEVFKVSYDGSYIEDVIIYQDWLNLSGTIWLHPKIGVIKTVGWETIDTLGSIPKTKAYIETQLKNINWNL